MANYLSVLSNDTLSHLALSGSPETLCGKAIVDEVQPRDESVDQEKKPNTNWLVEPLVCDICQTLSGGDSFLKENTAKTVEAGRACPHCEDGFDSSGNLCWNCGGTGWLGEGDEDENSLYADLNQGFDVDNLRGTKVAADYGYDVNPTDYLAPRVAVGPTDEEAEDAKGNKQKPGGWSGGPKAPLAYNADSNPSTPPRKGPHFNYPDTGKSEDTQMTDSFKAAKSDTTPWPQDVVCASCVGEGDRAMLIGYRQLAHKAWDRSASAPDERTAQIHEATAEKYNNTYHAMLENMQRRHQGTLDENEGCSMFYPISVYASFNASEERCDNCGEPTGGVSKTVGNQQWCTSCATAPVSTNTEYKTATNWTRDGTPIEDGFNVIISTEEAARIPFLDTARVSVSEKRHCPDCGEDKWLQAVASCDSCGHLKCKSCMEVIGMDAFFGTCKKCASANPDLAYEVAYEDASTDQDRYLGFLLQDREDENYDSLFLPGSDEV